MPRVAPGDTLVEIAPLIPRARKFVAFVLRNMERLAGKLHRPVFVSIGTGGEAVQPNYRLYTTSFGGDNFAIETFSGRTHKPLPKQADTLGLDSLRSWSTATNSIEEIRECWKRLPRIARTRW